MKLKLISRQIAMMAWKWELHRNWSWCCIWSVEGMAQVFSTNYRTKKSPAIAMVEYFLNSMENFFKHELISFPMKEVEDD